LGFLSRRAEFDEYSAASRIRSVDGLHASALPFWNLSRRRVGGQRLPPTSSALFRGVESPDGSGLNGVLTVTNLEVMKQ
jgi:hypothetical protein